MWSYQKYTFEVDFRSGEKGVRWTKTLDEAISTSH